MHLAPSPDLAPSSASVSVSGIVCNFFSLFFYFFKFGNRLPYIMFCNNYSLHVDPIVDGDFIGFGWLWHDIKCYVFLLLQLLFQNVLL